MNINNADLSFANNGTKRSKTDTLCLHHTGSTVLQSVRNIHNYHRYTNGWAGIGYHYYVRKDGTVWQGRPDNLIGAHAPSINENSVAVCFEGNFEKEKMGSKQLNAGRELIQYILKKYPSIKKTVKHRDVTATACPGVNFPFKELIEKLPLDTDKAQSAKNFLVKILDDGLNIRKGPGTDYKINGVIKDHGIYTIVDTKGTFGESGSWGKLKSGAGWISLWKGYVKKI